MSGDAMIHQHGNQTGAELAAVCHSRSSAASARLARRMQEKSCGVRLTGIQKAARAIAEERRAVMLQAGRERDTPRQYGAIALHKDRQER